MSANWQHGSTFVDPLMARCRRSEQSLYNSERIETGVSGTLCSGAQVAPQMSSDQRGCIAGVNL